MFRRARPVPLCVFGRNSPRIRTLGGAMTLNSASTRLYVTSEHIGKTHGAFKDKRFKTGEKSDDFAAENASAYDARTAAQHLDASKTTTQKIQDAAGTIKSTASGVKETVKKAAETVKDTPKKAKAAIEEEISGPIKRYSYEFWAAMSMSFVGIAMYLWWMTWPSSDAPANKDGQPRA